MLLLFFHGTEADDQTKSFALVRCFSFISLFSKKKLNNSVSLHFYKEQVLLGEFSGNLLIEKIDRKKIKEHQKRTNLKFMRDLSLEVDLES